MVSSFIVLVLGWFLLGWLGCCLEQADFGTPLVVAPSGNWDGADGPWSTFNLAVGDPVQLFRCIPGISSPVVILPVQGEWCNATCVEQTPVFDSASSNSWRTAGVYSIPADISEYVSDYNDEDSDGGSIWGVDNIYLGKTAKDRAIRELYIVLTTQQRFQVGTLGLFPGSAERPGDQHVSFLDQLYGSERGIPSRSFSYTAGSANRNTSGSLVLGGYDTSRFDPSTTLIWSMPGTQNVSLHVSVDAIEISNVTVWKPRLGDSTSSPTWFAIDSAVPQIWLPEEACALFEAAFGLIWDDELKLYLVNDTTHTRLLSESPEVRFSLSSGELSKNLYASILGVRPQAHLPVCKHFYVLFSTKESIGPRTIYARSNVSAGIYITVDYERQNFSLSQAYPDGGSAYIIPITSPSDMPQNSDESLLPPPNEPKHLSSAAIAGISVGTCIAALSALFLIVVWKKHLAPSRRKASKEGDVYDKAELHGDHKPWVEAMEKERIELDAATGTHEATSQERSELETVENVREVGVAEVHGIAHVHELPGHDDSVRVTDEEARAC